MKRPLLHIVLTGFCFGQPTLVYEPPSVAKFETYLFAGRPQRGNYHLAGGVDWRIGYPFLAGVFYEKEKGMDGAGIRAKVRFSLFWRFKNDFSFGTVVEKRKDKRAGFLVQAEQVVFLKRSFSLRTVEGYVFGNREVKRWVLAVGFGF